MAAVRSGALLAAASALATTLLIVHRRRRANAAGGVEGRVTQQPTSDTSRVCEAADHTLLPGVQGQGILCVGLACIDNVAVVPRLPEEDGEIRAIEIKRVRGGNATNMLNVCRQLGARAAWIGTLSEDSQDDARFVVATLDKDGIDCSRRVACPGASVPVSFITLSQTKGTRTIVHHRNLPELSCADFFRAFSGGDTSLPAVADALRSWRCIHFEGRNVVETSAIMRLLRQARQLLLPASARGAPLASPASGGACGSTHKLDTGSPEVGWRRLQRLGLPLLTVEIEKARRGVAQHLIPLADVAFVSREYAMKRGCATAKGVLEDLIPLATSGAVLTCAWGESGATAVDLGESAAQQAAHAAAIMQHGHGHGHRGAGRPWQDADERPDASAPVVVYHGGSGGGASGGGNFHYVQCEAFAPESGVVDTVGAGDTFNAAFLCGLVDGLQPEGALMLACAVAGTKVGQPGMSGIISGCGPSRLKALHNVADKARRL